jgi:hypothetical protein
MEPTSAGQLVKVAAGGPEDLDGVAFDVPSSTKVVVAVVDPVRGPVFRTFHPDAISERTEAAPGDKALQLLIRRTPPPPSRSGERGGSGSVSGRSGHSRGTMHRTTGK